MHLSALHQLAFKVFGCLVVVHLPGCPSACQGSSGSDGACANPACGPRLPWYLPAPAMGLGPVDRGEPAETVRSTPYPRSPPAQPAKCSTLPVLQSTIMDTNSLSQSLDSVNTAISVVGEEEVSVFSAGTRAASASAQWGHELPDRTI